MRRSLHVKEQKPSVTANVLFAITENTCDTCAPPVPGTWPWRRYDRTPLLFHRIDLPPSPYLLQYLKNPPLFSISFDTDCHLPQIICSGHGNPPTSKLNQNPNSSNSRLYLSLQQRVTLNHFSFLHRLHHAPLFEQSQYISLLWTCQGLVSDMHGGWSKLPRDGAGARVSTRITRVTMLWTLMASEFSMVGIRTRETRMR